MDKSKKLSEKSFAVLSLIADGLSYEQIIDNHPEITYPDIFKAAEEALSHNESESKYKERMVAIKSRYPRAYKKWTDDEDRKLSLMHAQGDKVAIIAKALERQPSAIRSRLAKLQLDVPEK
jgi:hypothetical protein